MPLKEIKLRTKQRESGKKLRLEEIDMSVNKYSIWSYKIKHMSI